IHFSWMRRSRIEADDWEAADIPLDEPEERYRIDVLDGPRVKRAAEAAGASFLYAAMDELEDFGSRQTSLAVRVRQIGRAVPLGLPADVVISL
ncbi:MAG TPA: hypothetical protein VHG11_04270, partial [Pseudorhizobium sp.]|nr:hypothetical protein [Pseudorhizobium sp.]